LTRRVSAQSETIDRYVREEKIVPDLKVPIGEKRYFNYFLPGRVSEYCKQFGWEQITAANRKTKFMEMAEKMQMSYSYKPVFIKAFLDFMDEDGKARLEDVIGGFTEFYENRKQSGLPPEKKPCIFTKGEYSNKDVENLILSMPFKRFEDMGFMHHSKNIGIIQLDRDIIKNLTDDDVKKLIAGADKALNKYFGS
jgi:hypothetical protein